MSNVQAARTNLATTISNEWDATLRRAEKNVTDDVNSISAAIEKGGYLGGAVQAVDVFSVGHQTANLLEDFRVIGSDPAVKEGVSGAVNGLAGNTLAALKDAADFIAALGSPSSAAKPAPPQSAPAPSQAPATGDGYPVRGGSSGNVVETQRACLAEVKKLQINFDEIAGQYRDWKKNNPDVREPSNGSMTLGEVLESDLPDSHKCVHIVTIIVHEHPELLEEAGAVPPGQGRATIPSGEVPAAPQAPEAPQAPQAPAAGGDFLSMLGQTFGPLMQMLGPVAQVLGGVLASPIGIGLLEAACVAIPGAQVLIPFIPFIAPAAGLLLTGAGGMMGGAGGQPGAAPGQAAPGLDLNALIGGITGLLGGVGGVAGAPAPAPVPVTA